jgi:uncharacterized protein YgiM (DUF1202 family)
MRKTCIISLTALCLLFVTAATAAAFGAIRYPDRPLNLRSARSAQARWVGSLHPGQKVRTGFMKDGWVAVFEPGETRADESFAVGYSNAKFLLPKPTRVEPETWGELMVTPRKLNIRDGASVRSGLVGNLEAMERVKVDFPEGDWIMVFYPDATIRSQMNARGYCSAKYFEPVAAQAALAPDERQQAVSVKAEPQQAAPLAAPQSIGDDLPSVSGTAEVRGATVQPPVTAVAAEGPSPSASSGDWGKIVTLQSDVNLRTERTSGSAQVRTLKAGGRVRVDFLKNGWYAVFEENEVLRSENRALGYALRGLIEGEDVGQEAVSPEPDAKTGPSQPSQPVGVQESGKQTMVIDRSRFAGSKRPDPSPNKTAHGYQYRLLEKSETKKYGVTWITLKVFLSTTKLPDATQLKDFCTTLWNEHRRATRNLVVLVYLPGMDTDDLAYGVVSYDDKTMLELWVRQVALFGTKFL